MLENDLNMIDLVLTHLNQPWGPLEPWRPLATLGDPWRPLATMPENGHFGHFQAFLGMSPMVAKGLQGSRDPPGLVEMS